MVGLICNKLRLPKDLYLKWTQIESQSRMRMIAIGNKRREESQKKAKQSKKEEEI